MNVVYAHNDDMALGAMQVLAENGKEDVFIAGVDGLSEALDAMADGGNYVATAPNAPKYLGDVTIQVARQVINGGEVPEFVDAGSQVVIAGNVSEFPREGLFAEFTAKVLD